jgi:general secretion pathway protein C
MTFAFRRCFWVVDLAFLAGAAFLCAATASALASHPIPLPELPMQPALAPATAPAMLDLTAVSRVTGIPLAQPEPTVEPVEVVPSSLALRLLGTSVSSLPDYSLAALQDMRSHQTLVVILGDEVQGAQVVSIERLRVIVDNHGRRETIDLASGLVDPAMPVPSPAASSLAGITQVGPRTFEVDRSWALNLLANPGLELSKMFWMPAYDSGAMRGFKLQRLAQDAVLGKLGLSQGDVVRRINGFELTNTGKILEVLTGLRDAQRIDVELDHNGAAQRLEIRVHG